jgi:hypothetical protein
MGTWDNPQGAVLFAARIEVNPNRKHVFKHRRRGLNVEHVCLD